VDAGLLADRLSQDTFLHARLSQSAAELWGLDVDESGIRRLRDLGYDNMHAGSAEAPPIGLPRGYFDVIVAGEIIEHVRNVGLLLESAADLLTPTGRIVITTPNALRFYNPLPALIRKELVHPDHLTWFSPYTLCRAVEAGPFRVEELNVYSITPSPRLRGVTNPVDWVIRALSKCLIPPLHGAVVSLFPYLSDGLIVVGRCSKSAE
jgi:SAM-dependent methyltransferase